MSPATTTTRLTRAIESGALAAAKAREKWLIAGPAINARLAAGRVVSTTAPRGDKRSCDGNACLRFGGTRPNPSHQAGFGVLWPSRWRDVAPFAGFRRGCVPLVFHGVAGTTIHCTPQAVGSVGGRPPYLRGRRERTRAPTRGRNVFPPRCRPLARREYAPRCRSTRRRTSSAPPGVGNPRVGRRGGGYLAWVMSAPEGPARAKRAARLAAEHGVDDQGGSGRWAAVVLRDGRAEFVRGDDIDGLLALGELVALVDLDYEPRLR
jgi:hypothetical protein